MLTMINVVYFSREENRLPKYILNKTICYEK